MRILRIWLAFIVLASFGFSKSNMEFGKNVYLQENSIVFDIVNSGISTDKIGQITHKPLIICDHNLSGFIEYTSKTQYRYFYDKPIIKNEKYSCTINTKYSTKKSKTTFYTDNFHVKIVTFTAPNVINVRFKDRVSNEEFLKNISLEKVTKLAKSKLSYNIERSDGINFLLRTHEDAQTIVFHVPKSLKSIHGKNIAFDWHPTLSDTDRNYKTNKDTKSLIFYDNPSWGVGKDGKIVLRVFVNQYLNANSNVRKFINIKGVKNFSVTDTDWVNDKMQKKYALHDKSWNYFDIIGDFKPNTTYQIEFLSGFGNMQAQLFEDKTYSVKSGDFGHYVGFDNIDKPYISHFGDIGITSVNVDKINVVVDKMLEQNLRYFLNFDNNLDIKKASHEVISKSFDLGGEKNVYTKHKISLKDALKGLKNGIYGVSIHYGENKYAYKKVYLSDIGISAKVYKDGIFVWSSSLKDTSLIKNAKVEIFSSSNILIASGKTDEYGIFKYNKKDFISLKPKSIIITNGDDKNFLVLNKTNDNTNINHINKNKQSYNAYVYFQTQIIRPDESVKALVVFKDKDYKSLKNAPIRVKIVDPIDKIVYDKAFNTNENGVFSFSHSLKGNKSGEYRMLVYFADKLKANKRFLVEAFLPHKVKSDIILPKSDIKTDSFFEVKSETNYLFGSPASYMKGSFRLKATSKDFKSKTFKDYIFTNKILSQSNTINYINDIKNITLDKNGATKALLSTNISQRPPSILDAQVEFTVLDDGRSVSTYKSVDIYPYDAMVGLNIEQSILDTDTPVKIDTLLLNPLNDEKLQAKLDVYVYENSWYYTYDTNGFYKWNQERNRVEHFTINAGDKIEKIFQKSGDYIIEVKDSLGFHSATVDFSVRGWDYSSLSPTNKISQNQVKYEDKLYKKGDIVKLDIKTPMKKGKMLLSLESDTILWYKVIDFQNAHLKVDIPLEVDLEDGLYIHTIAVRSSDTPSNIIPFRATSSSFIKPNRENYKLKPTILAQDITTSNTIIPVRVKASENSTLLISVVDDGILNILDQKPPNPFKFFTIKPKKRVANFDIYDLLLNYVTQGKQLNFGSGILKMAKNKKHLSPQTGAKRVKPFVYFSKLITIDKTKEAKVDLKIPSSYNGSATIVAIEIGDEKIGSISKKITVKDDVIIKPVYPKYGSVGDRWSIPIRVFNTTNKAMPLSLNIKTNELINVENFNKNIELKPNSSKLFYKDFNIKKFGKGEVEIIAKTPDKSFSHKIELPLIFAYPLDTYNEQGESKTPLLLKAPDIYMKGLTPSFSLSVSGDVLAQLKGGNDYLISYPYGCTEQTSSKMLALLKMPNFINSQNKEELNAKLNDRDRFIKEGIQKVANLQKNSGSFGYWDPNGYVNIYASIYTSDILYDLKNNNYDVPNYVLQGVKKSLKTFSNLKDKVNYFNRVYATYLLATKGIVNISNVNNIYDKKIYQNNLPSIYMMAYILKKARMHSEMEAVLKLAYSYNFLKLEKSTRDYGAAFDSYPRDIAFALYLHVKHFKKNKTSDQLFRRVKKEFKNLYSTQDKAFALRAISEYYKGDKKGKNEFIITGGGVDEIYDYEANIGGIYKKNSIKLTPKQNWINYNFSVMQYLPKPIKHEVLKNSKKILSIYRTFVDENGKNVDLGKLKIGQLIYSKVSLLAKEDIDNVVINEQVPSCFEIVNERIYKTKRVKILQNSKNFKPNFVDIRDDKILTFLSLKSANQVNFLTPLRVTTKGVCKLPAIFSEAMYDERINDYDLSQNEVIVK